MIGAAELVSIAWLIHAVLFLIGALVIARKARFEHQRILVWPFEDRWLVCGFMLCWMLICLDAVRLREQPDTWGIDHSLNNDITVLLRFIPVPFAIMLIGRIDRGYYIERFWNCFCAHSHLCRVRITPRDGDS
jgi:hypothetical protein